MDAKGEGAALPPVPLGLLRAGARARLTGRGLRDSVPPRCGMCGARMLTSHGHGLCPACGYLAAPDERGEER
jgi:hypothetical protein